MVIDGGSDGRIWYWRHWLGWRIYTDDCERVDPRGVAEPGRNADVPWTEDVHGGFSDRASEVVRPEPE